MKVKLKKAKSQAQSAERRLYGQRCAVARALDNVGERWTLLLIRELMVGPRRFKDMIEGLPGIGTNLLAARLKELERVGIISRRALPPPAGATVYELTALGLGLEPVVFALGRWGHQFLRQPVPGEVSKPGWFIVALRAMFRPETTAGIRAQYEILIDGELFHLEIDNGRLRVGQGTASRPDIRLTTDLKTLSGIIAKKLSLREALRSGKASLVGSRQQLKRFVAFFGGTRYWNSGVSNTQVSKQR